MNKIFLVGRLGKDPESKATQGGTHVSNFTLATDDGYGDNKKTNWHNIVAFGKTADAVNSYLGKGSLVSVVGSVQYRSWDKKDGTKGYMTEVVADQVEFLNTQQPSNNEFNQDTPYNEEDSSDLPF